jgi:hypothetical protein
MVKMKSYSETDVFTSKELTLLKVAQSCVEHVQHREGVTIRCHELARAVGKVLKLDVVDGSYGFVDHSWLWTTPCPKRLVGSDLYVGFPNILDVYSVGQLPMVRLVACDHPQLPHLGWAYRPGSPRTDINHRLVVMLIKDMKNGLI